MWINIQDVTMTDTCEVLSALLSAILIALVWRGTSRCEGLERKLCEWMMLCSSIVPIVFLTAMSQYYYIQQTIDDWFMALWPASFGISVYSGYLTAKLIAMSVRAEDGEVTDR